MRRSYGVENLTFGRTSVADSPPSGLSVTVTPELAAQGETFTVSVEWTGFPRVDPEIQWLIDGVEIEGATGTTYVATVTGVLTAYVSIDNGIGSDNATSAGVTVTSGAAAIEDPGTIVGSKVGETASVTGLVWLNGGTASYEWRADDVAVGTGITFPITAAEDGKDLVRITTVENDFGSDSGTTPAVTVTRVAPVAAGLLPDVSAEVGDVVTVDAAADFTGSGIEYSITTGGAFASVNSATGLVTIDTSEAVVGQAIVVQGANSGGIAASSFALTVTEVGAVVPVNSVPPAITGNGKIGSEHTRSTGTYSPAPDEFETEWTASGILIENQTGAAYTPQAGDNLTDLRVRTRARQTGGEWSAWVESDPVAITYVAPEASGTIPNQTFDQNAATTLDVAAYFTGGGLSYAVTTGGTRASVSGSVLTFVDGTAVADFAIVVTASNSGGSATQGFTLTIEAVAAGDLKAQVEALDGTVGRTSVNSLKEVGVDSFPSGVAITSPAWVIRVTSDDVVLEDWDLTSYRVEPTGKRLTIRQCVLGEQDGPVDNLNYYLNVGTTADDCLVEDCDWIGFDGVGGAGAFVNMLTAGGDLDPTVASGLHIRRCRFSAADGDYLKLHGAGTIIEQNVFEQCVCWPVGTVEYNPATSYTTGDAVLNAAGKLHVARNDGILSAPATGTATTTDWTGLDPHNDLITVRGALGLIIIRNNLFKDHSDARSPGMTQQIRYVRNTGTPIYGGEVRVIGNVFEEWGGIYPFAQGGIRGWLSNTSYALGYFAERNERRFQSLIAANRGNDPEQEPGLWEQVYDTFFDGPGVWRHNWMDLGRTGSYYAPGVFAGSLTVWDTNLNTVTGDPVPPPDEAIVVSTAQPAFGTSNTDAFPPKFGPWPAAYVTPTAYGSLRIGGATISACAVSVHGQLAAYFPESGTPVVLANRGFTLTDQGGGTWLLSSTAGTDPLEYTVYAGEATVTEEPATLPTTVVFGILGMSTMEYILNPGGTYGRIPDPTGIPSTPNVTAWTDSTNTGGSGTQVKRVVTAAAVAAGQINPVIANWSVFWHRVAPGVMFHVVDLAVPGTDRQSLMNSNNSDVRWPAFTAMLDAVRAEGLELDAIIENWGGGGGAATMKNYGPEWAPFYMGQRWGGGAFALGSTNPDSTFNSSQVVNNILWDITAPADQKGRGVFTRDRTKLYFSGWNTMTSAALAPTPEFINSSTESDGTSAPGDAFALDAPARQALHDFLADSRVQTFAGHYIGSAHIAEMDGSNHPNRDDPDGQIFMSTGIAIAALKVAQRTVFDPYIEFATVPEGGAYADVTVRLPNGGNLTTIRQLEGRSPIASEPPHYQPVMGFEIGRAADDDDERRPVFKLSETSYPAAYRGTVTIQDSGSGLPRRGTIRITPSVPFATGDRLDFGRGDASLMLQRPRDVLAKFYLNMPLETVPAWRDVTATYPFPGVAVKPQPAQMTLTVGSASAQPPVNTVAPLVAGEALEGDTLTVTNGTWSGDIPITYTYQWKRGGAAIPGATTATYFTGDDDIGLLITCDVTATNAAGSATQGSSNAVGPIAATTGTAPVNTVAPVLSGTPEVGETLSVTDGTWTGGGTLTRQWKRDLAAISGETGATYTLAEADLGRNIRVSVSSDNGIGAPVREDSNSLGPVTAAAAGAITIEQTGIGLINSTNDTTTNPSYTSASITIGTKAARMLVVAVHGYAETTNSAPSDLTVSFGGNAMTASLAATPTPSSRGFIAIYTLANPPSGANTFTVGWTGGRRAVAATWAEISGVGSVVATGAVNSGGSSVSTLGFTRDAGDLMLSALVLASGNLGAQITSTGTLEESGQTGTLGSSDTSFGLSSSLGGHAFNWTTTDRAGLGWIELAEA